MNYKNNLEARVAAFNKVNEEANRLHPLLLDFFLQYVGKKVLIKNGESLAGKVKEKFNQIIILPGFSMYRQSGANWLCYILRRVEQTGGQYSNSMIAEASMSIGNVADDGVMTDVVALPTAPLRRTNYSVSQIEDLRKIASAKREEARQAESALHPFGDYDR